MATQTETYKLNKPARTDQIDVDLLNENMDIIEEELKKRPLSSDTAGATYYDLDLREATDFDVMDGEEIQSIDVTEYVDVDELFTAAANGRLIRLRTKDSATSSVICAFLTDYTDYSDNSNTLRVILGTYWYDTASERLSHFQIIQLGSSIRLRWLCAQKSGGGTVKTVNGVEPDENGNVEVPTAEGTVKFVNGIAPDETGNAVLLSTTGLSIDWANGTYTETLSDGTSHTEDIEFNSSGVPTKFGSMAFSITGV